MDRIPDPTLRALARSFIAQGRGYGFGFEDYVRFVNVLLDQAMDVVPLPESTSATLPLVGDRVHVRAATPDDRDHIQRWCGGPGGRFFLVSRTTGLMRTVDELLADPTCTVGIVTLPDGRPVGTVAYLQVDPEQGRAELRKLIGEEDLRGQGLGTEAAQLWVAFGRHGLRLRKVFLFTLATNRRNVQLNERLGFRIEGVLRREVVIDGQAEDLLRMGLLVG